MSFSDCLIASWYGQRKPFRWLAPLSTFYAKQVIKRRNAYLSGAKKVYKAPVPVIVVGNISVGGTGKTPLILWLIDYCRSKNLSVGVVSRGYGAKPPHFPWSVTKDQSAKEAGDEPLLIVKRTGVPLVIDPIRANAAKQLLATEKIDIILCDDGLQHYPLARDLELVVIDAARGLGNGYCLPMGPLREPAGRLESVDAVIYNGVVDAGDGIFSMRLEPTSFVNILTGESCGIESFKKIQPVNAVAGIGNPQRFFRTLSELNFQLIEHVFSDHAQYTPELLSFNNDYAIIMTEKDAVKCYGFAKPNWWYLKVITEPSANFKNWFEQKITKLVS